MNKEDEIIRKRYPHAAPDRSAHDTEEDYRNALMRFYESQAELTTWIFETLPYPVVSTLHDGTIAFANVHAQQLLGLTCDELTRHKALEFLYDADGHPIGESMGHRIAAREMIRQEAVYVQRPDGRRELRILTVTPIRAPGLQTIVRAVGIFQDPTICERELESLRVLNEQLTSAFDGLKEDVERYKLMAYTDHMTGVMNKPAFSRDARQRIAEQRRRRGSVGFLFLDPDDFKQLNDTYGHDHGDELIQQLASRGRILAEKHGGILGRFGGDEFYALFTDLAATSFEKIVDEFAKAMPFDSEAANIRTGVWHRFHIDVSFGGSFRSAGVIPDLRILLKEADKAMLECKDRKGVDRDKPYLIYFDSPIHSGKSLQP